MTNRITQEHVDNVLKRAKIVFDKFGNKTSVGVCTLPNGFIIVESSSCVDPRNFDHEIGKSIIMKRFEDKVWELEGYLLQSKVTANGTD